MLQFDAQGNLLKSWGGRGAGYMAIDSKGNLYTAEVGTGRCTQKFARVQ